MAVELLAAYLTLHFPGEVILIQYVDDILLVLADASRPHTETTMLMAKMCTAGWIISVKSQVEPTTQLTWMGKHLNGQSYTLMQSSKYMAMWVKLATKGYNHRTMRHLCGKLVWGTRPGRGAMPFLAGSLA